MAPRNQNQLEPSFDPSRDIDTYMSDKGEALRQRGLQKQSIRLYELLCRLCPPGESQLVYDQQADLVSDLKRLGPGESGLTEGSVSRKLNRLASLGFAAKSGGGQSNCPLVVDLYLPDLVAPKPPRPRKPAVVVSPSDERQGQFFDGGAAFRLVGADDEPPEAQSLAVLKAQSLALSVGESASDCAFRAGATGRTHLLSAHTRAGTRGRRRSRRRRRVDRRKFRISGFRIRTGRRVGDRRSGGLGSPESARNNSIKRLRR